MGNNKQKRKKGERDGLGSNLAAESEALRVKELQEIFGTYAKETITQGIDWHSAQSVNNNNISFLWSPNTTIGANTTTTTYECKSESICNGNYEMGEGWYFGTTSDTPDKTPTLAV